MSGDAPSGSVGSMGLPAPSPTGPGSSTLHHPVALQRLRVAVGTALPIPPRLLGGSGVGIW